MSKSQYTILIYLYARSSLFCCDLESVELRMCTVTCPLFTKSWQLWISFPCRYTAQIWEGLQQQERKSFKIKYTVEPLIRGHPWGSG